MKKQNTLRYAVISAFLLSAVTVAAADKQQDQLRIHTDDPQYLQIKDQDQLKDQDTLQDQDRDRLRLHTDDPQDLQVQQQQRTREQQRLHIYGSELMTAEERTQYREQYYALQTDEERKQFQHEHQITIRQRAQAAGIPMPVESPVQLQNAAGKTTADSYQKGGSSASSHSGMKSSSKSGGSSGGQGSGGGGGGRK